MRLTPRALLSTRMRLAATLVVVILLLAGGTTWVMTRDDATAAASTDTLVAAASATVRSTVTATGTIEPARQADLSFSVSGTVTAVPVTVGQAVKAGQELARVDDGTLASTVASAEASVTAAEAAVTAQQDADASDTQLASANAQLVKAKADLADARSSLDAASLTSTINGTVADVSVAVGDRMTGGSSGAAGAGAATSGSSTTAAVTVISTNAFVVDAAVGSADLAKVKKGLQVEITPTGATQKAFGTVTSVGIVATTTSTTAGTGAAASGSATFPVTIAVTGTPTGLYAGGSASVVIVVSQTPNVLTVPTQALHTTDGKTVVHQRVAGKEVSTPITIGTSYGPTTQVLTGLAAGDEVLVPAARAGVPGGTGRVGGGTGGAEGGAGAGGFGGGAGTGFGGGQ